MIYPAVILLSLLAASVHGPTDEGGSGCSLNGVTVPGLSVRALDADRFRALHAAVTPAGTGERWMQVPWLLDLQAARRRSAAEGKPLFLWVMDGHPLGCT